MLSMIAVLFLAVCSTTVTAQIEGGTCGVGGAEDFFKSDFKGPYLVSGPGCQLGHAKDCYCTVDYGNAESNGWIWLCGTTVFGPAEGKTCPAEIPVMEGSDVHPDCDTAVNPTGVSEADAGCGECLTTTDAIKMESQSLVKKCESLMILSFFLS